MNRVDGDLTVNGVPICSAEGSRQAQGCAFGAFFLVLHRSSHITDASLLRSPQKALHPTVLFLCYMDDAYTFHPTDPVEATNAMNTLRMHLEARCTLDSVPSKS